MLVACAAGGQEPPRPRHPGRAFAAPHPDSGRWINAVRLRGERPGAVAPLATLAGALRLDPDSMHGCAKRLMHMLTGRYEQAANMHVSTYQRHVSVQLF